MITLGLEEEFFLTQPVLPTLHSFTPMAKLLWSNPRRHFRRTASNFARGADARRVLMGPVELSTGVHTRTADLLADLKTRRRELAAKSGALCVPVGNLFDLVCPSNVAGLHVHLGTLPDPKRAYRLVAWYLPLVMRYGAHAPVAGGRAAPPSWRMAHGYAFGPLDGSYDRRFQDLILARRLGTLEVRVLDPHWNLSHYGALVELLRDIAALDEDRPLDLDRYARLRALALAPQTAEELVVLEDDLKQRVSTPFSLREPLAYEQTLAWFEAEGTEGAYRRLDGGFRTGVAAPAHTNVARHNWAAALLGFVGYYLPRLPYIALKAWREN